MQEFFKRLRKSQIYEKAKISPFIINSIPEFCLAKAIRSNYLHEKLCKSELLLLNSYKIVTVVLIMMTCLTLVYLELLVINDLAR